MVDNSKIIKIIGFDDPTVIDFLKKIKRQNNSIFQFSQKVKELDVGLDLRTIQQLFHALSNENKTISATSLARNRISQVLTRELNLKDSNVTDLLTDILTNSTSLEEFKTKLHDIDSGLSDKSIISIYTYYDKHRKQSENIPASKLVKNENIDTTSSGLGMPNAKVKWDDVVNPKDIPKNEDSSSFQNKRNNIPIELNMIYKGRISKIVPFGCFVQLLGVEQNRTDALVHISQLSNERINDPRDIVKQNQHVFVKVIQIQRNGKISLSMKNINQESGIETVSTGIANNRQDRGRPTKRDPNENNKIIRKRKLTSPERWEIMQLISSGAAKIEEYPELMQDSTKGTNEISTDTKNSDQDDTANTEEDDLDIELNSNDHPDFLKSEFKSGFKKFEMPKVSKLPRGQMSKQAHYGSNLLKNHREEKIQKKKEIEKQIRQKQNNDDPTLNKFEVRKEIAELKEQLAVTEWEKNKRHEKISFGHYTTLSIDEQRQSLPVFKMRSDLIKAVQENQFLIIVGETGSGKTTQITQYLNESGFATNGIIGCTQPRRVAAVSVSKRVAEEVGCKLGTEVGYTIRFEDETSSKTKIKYMTDGMLQIEALQDPLMSRYSVIMLDEAHERTIATDVLFTLLKRAGKERPDLRIIITSATLDSQKFSNFFFDCPIINIPGKTFPVEVMYSQSPQMDYIEASLDTVLDIHINEDPGDILVFLTGQEEIDSCCEILYEKVKALGDAIDELLILPIYSALPSEVQSKIFEPTPPGKRKVVFATNIAETSITIDGIYYVVDPGFSKINTYNSRVGMEQLVVSPISQAQANQRKGRAGRTGPGKCYRLYTENAFHNEMLPNTIPEIQRQNLSHTILMLKAMGINDLLNFDFMDPPPRNSMIRSLEELFHLEALNEEGHITTLGLRMSQFPMEPNLSRSLISSVNNSCSDEILTIMAMLSVQNIFYRPKEHRVQADQRKARFNHPYGDHMTLLNVYKQWQEAGCSEQFCSVNYLHFRHLRRARDVKDQLSMIFKRLNLPVTSCYGDPDTIRRTLITGFFMNAAKRDSQAEAGYKTLTGNTSVGIHPSSSLFGKEYEYVIYHSLVLTTREYMSCVSSIEPEWLLEMAPHYYKTVDENSKSRKKMKIAPLFDRFAKNSNSWRLSSIRASREKALGGKK